MVPRSRPALASIARKLGAALCAIGSVSAAQAGADGPLTMAETQLEPIQWSELAGWAGDDHAAAFAAFMDSCKPFLRRRRVANDTRPVYRGLWEACRQAAKAGAADAAKARAYFEGNFRPVRIAKLGESTGLITGYYEPIVAGSRFPNPEFHVPLYRRPPDLLIAGRKPTKAGGVPNRGNIVRRNGKGELEPYYDRAAIEAGALDGRKLEICWVRDPFEALSMQIQGSARVRLEDGQTVRLNYDAHNGHSYTAVGRVLIERKLVPREEMSMQRIRQWMHANPREAPEVRHSNRSFVFFRITGLSDDLEPAGAQGVHLMPGRSIAVDRMLHVYGTPFFIEGDLPIDSARPTTKFSRLMIAQDTGSAIIGPARADFYWGAGDQAGEVAGRLRHQGRFVMLVPLANDPVAAGRKMPLPRGRPPETKPKDAPDATGTDKKKPPTAAKGPPPAGAAKDKSPSLRTPPLPKPRASLNPNTSQKR
jgi:membrane-bound lytic murein transglycosylase A